MFSLFFKIINKYANEKIPPVMNGAKYMIEQVSEREQLLNKLNKNVYSKITYSMTREKENIADLFSHCVSKDFYKDAYSFINAT